MTLDEAIKHAEEVAEQNEWFEENYLENKGCKECAKEHRQLAEWLKDYKRLLEQESNTGHWIEKDGFDGDVYYDCSECGESWTTIEGTPWQNGMAYCPNCGCRMVEPQESEDKE